jgi:HPt (histidine-containing phosphotransfer) domain-containing protein
MMTLSAIADLAVIDDVAITEIKNALPPEMMDELCATFCRDCDQALGEFDGAVLAHDMLLIRKIAHRLKGIFAQFGAQQAAAYAARIAEGEDINPDFTQMCTRAKEAVHQALRQS